MSMPTILVCLPLLTTLISCAIAPKAGELKDGPLLPCPNRPNCVNSDGNDHSRDKQIDPISFTGSSEKAWKQIQGIIKDLGGEIMEDTSPYLWATFTSAVFHFVDDVELRMVPEEKLINIRSGARVGYWDLGVNKKRVQKIRRLFMEKQAQDQQSQTET